jgi:hypothetical protein
VSYSQEGAGAWLARLPDATSSGSVITSDLYTIACQRRLGLYLSALAPIHAAAAAAAAAPATQHERLGDAAINAANATHRHNSALHAVFTAFKSSDAATAPASALRLGDRGDGTPGSRAEALTRYAHINAGHVPDFIRHAAKPHCYEFKCYSPFAATRALGLGSNEHGGAASTADGGRFALGNTEEALIVLNTGVDARGLSTDRPFDRRTGVGRVHATTTHAYADAQRRKHPFTLLVTESSGALSATLSRALRAIGAQARLPTSTDHTAYGTARHSPRTFYSHHAAAISAAIVTADALTVLETAAHASYMLSIGRLA